MDLQDKPGSGSGEGANWSTQTWTLQDKPGSGSGEGANWSTLTWTLQLYKTSLGLGVGVGEGEEWEQTGVP